MDGEHDEIGWGGNIWYSAPPYGLGQCGCGDPDGRLRLIYKVLDMAPTWGDSYHQRDWLNDPAMECILVWLESAGLLTHGTYIVSFDTTDKGKRFLAWMKRVIDLTDNDEYADWGYSCVCGECRREASQGESEELKEAYEAIDDLTKEMEQLRKFAREKRSESPQPPK